MRTEYTRTIKLHSFQLDETRLKVAYDATVPSHLLDIDIKDELKLAHLGGDALCISNMDQNAHRKEEPVPTNIPKKLVRDMTKAAEARKAAQAAQALRGMLSVPKTYQKLR